MKPTFQMGYFLLPWISLLCVSPALATAVVPDVRPCSLSGIVFVVEGAGGSEHASRSIAAATDQVLPSLHVRSFSWTHGRCGGLADVVDAGYARCQGRLLAEEVCRYRNAYPGVAIYLVGFMPAPTLVWRRPNVCLLKPLNELSSWPRQCLRATTSVRRWPVLGKVSTPSSVSATDSILASGPR